MKCMKTLTLESVFLELGHNMAEIAHTLIKLNCKGNKLDSLCCPLVNYLKLRGYDPPIDWGICRSCVYQVFTPSRRTGELYKLSSPVRRFLCNFDNGVFPELELSPYRPTPVKLSDGSIFKN